jgi:hypothetical protein
MSMVGADGMSVGMRRTCHMAHEQTHGLGESSVREQSATTSICPHGSTDGLSAVRPTSSRIERGAMCMATWLIKA